MSDAKFLHIVGQRGLPLLVVYLESRRPIRRPGRVLVSVLLRPLVCMDFWDGCVVRIVGQPEPVPGVLKTGEAEMRLEFWPGRVA